MGERDIKRRAGCLNGMPTALLVLDVLCLPLVPGMAALFTDQGAGAMLDYLLAGLTGGYAAHTLGRMMLFFINCLWAVWLEPRAAVCALPCWLCMLLAAAVLWSARRAVGRGN